MQPLTHHEILSVVEPFTRRGRRVDLAASDRLQRRLAFKPVEHDADGGDATTALRETLELESLRSGRWCLTRVLTLPCGLEARLEAEGASPGELLADIEAVPTARQVRHRAGGVLALSHRVTGNTGNTGIIDTSAESPPLMLTQATTQVDGLALAMKVSPVSGIPGEIELKAPAGDSIELPDDLLAVQGWPWSRLTRVRDGWTASVRLSGSDAERSRDAEAKFARTARHLAQTLAEPPARFHERQRGARWGVTLRRAVPLLFTVGLFVGAAFVPRLDLAQDSVFRMLIFHAPPLLLMIFFCMREMPRIEIPPWPRPPTAPSWRQAPPAGVLRAEAG